MRYNRYRGNSPQKKRNPWLAVLLVLVAAGVLAFGALEIYIGLHSRDSVAGQPQTMVIFGCQVKPDGPSILLRDRLDTALSYWKDHPEIRIVVSGGKGDDEHISEAQCMYDYLTAHGADGARIVMEDQSRNTCQNIRNTLALVQAGAVQPATGSFLLVSSDFHLTRIKMLWGRIWPGTYTLSTLAAPCSHLPSRIHMFFREPLALVKSFVMDR